MKKFNTESIVTCIGSIALAATITAVGLKCFNIHQSIKQTQTQIQSQIEITKKPCTVVSYSECDNNQYKTTVDDNSGNRYAFVSDYYVEDGTFIVSFKGNKIVAANHIWAEDMTDNIFMTTNFFTGKEQDIKYNSTFTPCTIDPHKTVTIQYCECDSKRLPQSELTLKSPDTQKINKIFKQEEQLKKWIDKNPIPYAAQNPPSSPIR